MNKIRRLVVRQGEPVVIKASAQILNVIAGEACDEIRDDELLLDIVEAVTNFAWACTFILLNIEDNVPEGFQAILGAQSLSLNGRYLFVKTEEVKSEGIKL